MKLASGIALVGEMLAAGVPVGIGTDGEKENNNFDMFEEMKVASLLGKLKDLDAAAMDSWDVLRMATIIRRQAPSGSITRSARSKPASGPISSPCAPIRRA